MGDMTPRDHIRVAVEWAARAEAMPSTAKMIWAFGIAEAHARTARKLAEEVGV